MGKLFKPREETREAMLKDIEKGISRREYCNGRDDYKNKYKQINYNIEQLCEEEKSLESKLYTQTLPYFPLVSSLIITSIVTVLGFLNTFIKSNIQNPEVGNFISYLISVIIVMAFWYYFNKALEIGDARGKEYYLRLDAVKELKQEILEPGKFKDYYNEVVEEVAAEVEIDNIEYKAKNNNGIITFFKKRKLNKEKNSQTKLSQEFEKLKSLNQEELVVRKGWYSREAKDCRDIAKNIKNILNMVTIILTILSVIIPVYTQVINKSGEVVNNSFDRAFEIIQHKDIKNKEKEDAMFDLFNSMYGKESKDVNGYNEINILEDTFKTAIGCIAVVGLGSIFMIYFVSMHSSKYNNRASNYEILAEYIDDELIKD